MWCPPAIHNSELGSWRHRHSWEEAVKEETVVRNSGGIHTCSAFLNWGESVQYMKDLKCGIQWDLELSYIVKPSPLSSSKTFSPPQRKLVLIKQLLHLPLPSVCDNHKYIFCLNGFAYWDYPYQWNRTMWPFKIWHISRLSIMVLILVHVVARIKILNLLVAEQYSS